MDKKTPAHNRRGSNRVGRSAGDIQAKSASRLIGDIQAKSASRLIGDIKTKSTSRFAGTGGIFE